MREELQVLLCFLLFDVSYYIGEVAFVQNCEYAFLPADNCRHSRFVVNQRKFSETLPKFKCVDFYQSFHFINTLPVSGRLVELCDYPACRSHRYQRYLREWWRSWSRPTLFRKQFGSVRNSGFQKHRCISPKCCWICQGYPAYYWLNTYIF